MLSKKSIQVWLIVLLLVASATTYAKYMRRIGTGIWGGEHISMDIGAKSATIEYDCAHGVIQGPLVMDRRGNFNLRGTHTMERGGPVRADAQPNEQPATYTGSIKGNTMTLTLKLGDAEVETFTLEKGKEGELFKCK